MSPVQRSILLFSLVLTLCREAPALEQETAWLAEGQLTGRDAERSWTEGGLGKLRAGDSDAAARLALEYRLHIRETVSLHLALDGYAGSDTDGGFTEAWLRWNPVPTSPWAYGLRAGSIIPPFSLEHVDIGWTSPFMPTSSVLNAWIGEELRTNALELTIKRLGAQTRFRPSLEFKIAAFAGNDTAGTILSWRGWSANDRVTPIGNDLTLPERPALEPGGPFPGAERTDPFLEIDDSPGYYATANWDYRRVGLLLGRYDNLADPTAFRGGQGGWDTRFNLVGLRWHLNANSRVIAQYLDGNTILGRPSTGRYVDNDFRAWFVLASRDWRRHRFAARFERFQVTDLDRTPLDDNREDGDAWAISWQYGFDKGANLGVEFLRLDYDRPDRSLLGLEPSVSELQMRASLRYRF